MRWARVARYGGMKASDATRLKRLEIEMSRLKERLAEAELDKAFLSGDEDDGAGQSMGRYTWNW